MKIVPLRVIKSDKGDIYKGVSIQDDDFKSFGEAYFSSVIKNEIKGWKKHKKMTCNLIVISGEVKFVTFNSKTKIFNSVICSKSNYSKIIIQPEIWFAFKGLKNKNILLNIADIPHDPLESNTMQLSKIKYDW